MVKQVVILILADTDKVHYYSALALRFSIYCAYICDRISSLQCILYKVMPNRKLSWMFALVSDSDILWDPMTCPFLEPARKSLAG